MIAASQTAAQPDCQRNKNPRGRRGWYHHFSRIAPNKFLAKIASDWLKPNGQFTITPEQVDSFVYTLPVKKLLGVGSVTAKRMQNLGIHTCGDLQTVPLNDLTRHFGNLARAYIS